MSEVEEKPDVREQFGVAVSGVGLTVDPLVQRPVDRVIAMGAAVLEVRKGVPGRMRADPNAAELAPLLWRLKFGGDAALGGYAAQLLATRLTAREELKRAKHAWPWPKDPAFRIAAHQMRVLMTARVIHEWLHERCTECAGTGKVQVVKGKRMRVRAMGRAAAPGTQIRGCTKCGGSGGVAKRIDERAKALGVSIEVYRRDWDRRFEVAAWELRRVVDRLDSPMRVKLRKSLLQSS